MVGCVGTVANNGLSIGQRGDSDFGSPRVGSAVGDSDFGSHSPTISDGARYSEAPHFNVLLVLNL